MKKIILAALILIISMPAFAEISVPFFGGNSFSMDADTIFAANLNNGATGLQTIVGIGLWFEFTPYADRNITPQRNMLSVSLRMANSAFYAWRGYDGPDDSGYVGPTLWGQPDQAMSVWFDTFIAQLEYNEYWVRVAGIEPEITLSQASIKSVFDPVINNRTDVAKNRMPLPLFHSGGLYNGAGGVVSVIGQDLVNLNRREVEISGNLSAGMRTETFDLTFKVGSWKTVQQNNNNGWVAGVDFTLRPDFTNLISLSLLGALNYDTVTRRKGDENQSTVNDPMADPDALKENPIAFGVGYEYRLNLPGRMVMKPYIGVDFIYEINTNDFNFEIGGGLQWFFRGTGAQFKRNARLGGTQLGDVELPAALIAGFNVDRNGIVNGIISLNESPQFSLIPRLGGFLNLELMNITGNEYKAPDGKTYNDFLWAVLGQVEYLVNDRIMPYAFVRYVPGVINLEPGFKEDPEYALSFGRDFASLTTKIGCQFLLFSNFTIDVWYERNDVMDNKDWKLDNGLININFRISI
ncbi:MAG: hypothetical protein FWD13_07145 [Treponema sp.]|nr:hypothetical protein [Treponema sp.]